ncbi:MAG TPA: SDR family oxidoreductase [Peptococcaceae bacterium]|nr:SDR family oxidoreductase [Peptococcaceae bacterium]
MLLKDKIAIVTGAAQGIGKAIAKMYSEHGAYVVLCDIQEDKVKATALEIEKETGRKTVGLTVDVTKSEQVNAVVEKTLELFGRIDILVNNAGILRHALIIDTDEKMWDQIFNINVKGTFLFTKAVCSVMMKQRSGKIINMSSCSGKKPTLKEAAYSATKAAIIGFTRVAALEMGPYGINCNAICPGATDTDMIRNTFLTSPEVEQEWIDKTALKRLGRPEDQARVALFLASELSDHITGESLIVSAGELMGQ